METRAGLGSQRDPCSCLVSSRVSARQPCLNVLTLIFEMEIIKPAQRVIGRVSQKNVFETVALWRAESWHFVKNNCYLYLLIPEGFRTKGTPESRGRTMAGVGGQELLHQSFGDCCGALAESWEMYGPVYILRIGGERKSSTLHSVK